jgi:hypothetical protein
LCTKHLMPTTNSMHAYLMYSTLQVYQRSYSQVRHIPPKMFDKFESQHSLSPTIWSDVRVDIKRFFFLHFSRWICQTFCDRCVFVSVLSFRCVECAGSKYPSVFLPCTIFVPGKVAPRSIFVTLGHNSRSMHRSTS